ncbi:NTP transferase domain-containing protein [Streptomyces sp. NBC_01171]|uniref:NTP transferase domain-containing protein n=1 Tax=Streptomyces sp. NBC_01171 TaxID=2903757 RepID=UPI00386AC896|nr:NTP transferase domain-containing protein [Streptomyces sp. NBC_01171]
MTDNVPAGLPSAASPDSSGSGPATGAPYDAVVLAGGGARRLGGADKPGVQVGGRALLDRVLAACVDAVTTVVVADPRATARPVRWAREEPAGGGPVAALDAGLRLTTAEYAVVLSADLPFLGADTVHRLLAALRDSDADGAMLTDDDGRDQPLVAAYRTASLRGALADLAPEHGEHGGLTGLPLRRLTGALRLTRLTDPLASFDCDTWEDIAHARARIREHGHVLNEWITAVKNELGIELDVDTRVLLDAARDVAHGVARPAAPLTTFLIGYAAAQGKGDAESIAEASAKVADLAIRWEAEHSGGGSAPDAG